MAAPVKNILAPTGYSPRYLFSVKPTIRLLNYRPVTSNPMIVNALLNKFTFKAFSPKQPVVLPNSAISGPVKAFLPYFANTFPPAYTVTLARPTQGQLYPLSGLIPY